MLDNWLQLGTALTYEKELLPVGPLVRWVGDAANNINTTIKREFLDRVVSNFQKMRSAGVRVPIFKTHSEDPSNKRGQLHDVFVKKNSKNEDSLHFKGELDDGSAVELATKNDVSALIVPKFVDGKGNNYEWALRHVAITSTPVVPGLDDWKGPVVLAYEDPKLIHNGDENVNAALLNEIGEKLQLSFGSDATDDVKLRAILEGVKLSSLADEAGDDGGNDDALGGNNNGPVINLAFPPLMVRTMKTSREAIIDGLHKDDVISASMAGEWKGKYCTEQALQLDLQIEDGTTMFEHDVEQARKFAKDRPIGMNGRKRIELSNGGAGNPLVDNAKKRAEAATAKRQSAIR